MGRRCRPRKDGALANSFATMELGSGRAVQHRQDQQVRPCKQPLFRLLTRRLRCACDKADVPGARQNAETLEADARQGGSLGVREDLLARLDLDHAFALNHQSKRQLIVRRWPGLPARAVAPVFVALLLLVRTIAAVCAFSIEWGQQLWVGRIRVLHSGKALRL